MLDDAQQGEDSLPKTSIDTPAESLDLSMLVMARDLAKDYIDFCEVGDRDQLVEQHYENIKYIETRCAMIDLAHHPYTEFYKRRVEAGVDYGFDAEG